jgi:hypothetical protein
MEMSAQQSRPRALRSYMPSDQKGTIYRMCVQDPRNEEYRKVYINLEFLGPQEGSRPRGFRAHVKTPRAGFTNDVCASFHSQSATSLTIDGHHVHDYLFKQEYKNSNAGVLDKGCCGRLGMIRTVAQGVQQDQAHLYRCMWMCSSRRSCAGALTCSTQEHWLNMSDMLFVLMEQLSTANLHVEASRRGTTRDAVYFDYSDPLKFARKAMKVARAYRAVMFLLFTKVGQRRNPVQRRTFLIDAMQALHVGLAYVDANYVDAVNVIRCYTKATQADREEKYDNVSAAGLATLELMKFFMMPAHFPNQLTSAVEYATTASGRHFTRMVQDANAYVNALQIEEVGKVYFMEINGRSVVHEPAVEPAPFADTIDDDDKIDGALYDFLVNPPAEGFLQTHGFASAAPLPSDDAFNTTSLQPAPASPVFMLEPQPPPQPQPQPQLTVPTLLMPPQQDALVTGLQQQVLQQTQQLQQQQQQQQQRDHQQVQAIHLLQQQLDTQQRQHSEGLQQWQPLEDSQQTEPPSLLRKDGEQSLKRKSLQTSSANGAANDTQDSVTTTQYFPTSSSDAVAPQLVLDDDTLDTK